MKKIIVFISIVVPFIVLGQSTDQNYVKSTVYKTPTDRSILNPIPEQVTQNVTYFDGLGRPIQKIAHKQSGKGDDIVTHIEYDAFGRQTKEYLPIVNGHTLEYHNIDNTAVQSYYSPPAFSGLEYTDYPYSEKLLESSPLNRVMKQAAPGDDWHMGGGHEVKFDYQTNDKYEVKLYTASSDFVANTITLGNGGGGVFYEVNELYKTITTDENNNDTQEFKDKEGRVVLKRVYGTSVVGSTETQVWHETYYVYDQYGNLTFVIPPLVNDAGSQLEVLCYQYKYDYRNRLIEKKIPGKQWEYIAYNSQNMPVATGPVKNPWGSNTWGWLVTKYDVFGRVVYTGWVEGTDFKEERVTIESYLNATEWFENFTSEPTTIDDIPVNYSNQTKPLNMKLLTINYYDNYSYVGAPTLPSGVEGVDVLPSVKSLATGNWVRILDNPNNTNSELSYSLYDSKGRAIRTHKTNYLGGYTTVDSKLDFVGKPIYTNTYHKRVATSNEVVVKDTYEYTPEDRLLSHTHQINAGGIEELIAKNDYDDLGRLIIKQVGGQDITNYVGLQKVDYGYNIRGWLTDINYVDGLTPHEGTADLFAFKINYNTVENNVSNQVKALYNGNISETFWRSSTDNVLRKYGYQYDNLNRLKNSFYQKPNNVVPVTNMFNEQMSYDKNGNIQTLLRNGDFDSDFYGAIQIDNLSYVYDPDKKNQLLKVTDATNSPKGFRDDSNGTNDVNDDYMYDINGNLIRDENKFINNITYNHLNLPVLIFFGNGDRIDYLYDATGQKKSKKVTRELSEAITDYIDGYQYTDTILNFFPHAEGYVNVTPCAECENQMRFNYVYQYKDHLGNIRVSYGYDEVDEEIKIIEENHYYPFGLKHTKYNSEKNEYVLDEEYPERTKIVELPPGEKEIYKYKYNGKEWQDELGLNMYDYGARNYDPALGRWMNMDPLAEQYRRWSPYTYAMDNPVYFIDPDGMRTTAASAKNDDAATDNGEARDLQEWVARAGKRGKPGFVYNGWDEGNGNPPKKDENGNPPKKGKKGNILNWFTSEAGALYDVAEDDETNIDGVVIVYAHASPNLIVGPYGTIETPEAFDEILKEQSPAWKNFRENGGKLTLVIKGCSTGVEGGIAQQFSDFFEGLTVIGATNRYSAKSFAGVISWETGVINGGNWNVYYNNTLVNTFKGIKK
ncbi:DUF6443 domain-containing protein [Flavobacterium sangjuense]|uniref:DUF6443 domain-containing protein n=1 Tax=Flavobacterium sangjuense TaxID=2518177 RepID=A0A4P7PV61_9FLAO|nr:DUF6443 domain-containing protein [Flavobacterium sangjuense]QBZ98881.1 hypothetical protein GS03_02393 [Flavobacterium sangjuense]